MCDSKKIPLVGSRSEIPTISKRGFLAINELVSLPFECHDCIGLFQVVFGYYCGTSFRVLRRFSHVKQFTEFQKTVGYEYYVERYKKENLSVFTVSCSVYNSGYLVDGMRGEINWRIPDV